MTTSAYNLGNSGLASKFLRTKDLMRAAVVEGCAVLGFRLSAAGFRRSASGSRGGVVALSMLPISPSWHFSVKVVRHRDEIKFCGKSSGW